MTDLKDHNPIKRDTSADIIRIIAFILVLILHFLDHTDYYNAGIDSAPVYFAVFARTISETSVSLFIMITGFLFITKWKDDPAFDTKQIKIHYKKLLNIYGVYTLCVLFKIAFYVFVQNNSYNLRGVINEILGFKDYTWYMSMYFGLFLMMPFLNLLWKNLPDDKAKRSLIIVLLLLTVVPSVFNSFSYLTPGAFLHPTMTKQWDKLFPDWWEMIFPLTYYFLGGYIREKTENRKFSAVKTLILFASLSISLLFCGAYNIWRSKPYAQIIGPWADWRGWQNLLLATLIFLFFKSINFNRLPDLLRSAIGKLSKLTFAAFIVSYAVDLYVYGIVNDRYEYFAQKVHLIIICVPIVFTISLLIAFAIEAIAKLIGLVSKTVSQKTKPNND